MPSQELPPPPSRTRLWLRRLLYAAIALFSLVVCFYNIENVRGRNAWHEAVAELEAKGEKVAWKDHLPAPVPDDQNVLKAPMMEEWFVKDGLKPGWHDISALRAESARLYGHNPFPIATFRVVEPGKSDPAKPLIKWSTAQASNDLSWLYVLKASPAFKDEDELLLGQHNPGPGTVPEIQIENATPLTSEEIKSAIEAKDEGYGFFPNFVLKDTATPGVCQLDFNHVGELAYLAASDYLAYTDKFLPDLKLIREACQRPYCQLTLGPEASLAERITPISNKISLARLISCRVYAHHLLGLKDRAFEEYRDFEMAHRVSGFTPPLLINFLTSVALHGIERQFLADGLAENSWSREELRVMQEKWQRLDLLNGLAETIRNERAVCNHQLQKADPHLLLGMFADFGSRDKWREPWWYATLLAPEGWYLQNAARNTLGCQKVLDAMRATPGDLALAKTGSLAARGIHSPNPYAILATLPPMLVPIIEQTAHAQTTAHLAVLACALERHRLDKGAFPERLDALVPNYLARLPGQLVHAQPFHYRLEKDGGCTVWSEGWDLLDEGGLLSPHEGFSSRHAKDWGIRLPARTP